MACMTAMPGVVPGGCLKKCSSNISSEKEIYLKTKKTYMPIMSTTVNNMNLLTAQDTNIH